MTRRRIAIVLLIVAACLVILTPLLAFTPLGNSWLNTVGLAAPADTPTPTPKPFTPTPPPPPTPILTVQGTPPATTATASYLLDADTGHTLVDDNGEKPLPMASTTKIMTALITIQTANLDQVVTIQQDAKNEVIDNGGSSAFLVVGDKIRLGDLLYGLMLPSGDDAAVAIADAVAGSVAKFVQRMNLFAYRLRLFQTHYADVDGLPAPNHYTTAHDLVRLAQYVMTIPAFTQIVQSQHYLLGASGTHARYDWTNTNTLLGSYQGANGIKTGTTDEAGFCLVFSATRQGHHLIGVVLHSSSEAARITDAQKLLNWGFALPLLPPQ